MEVSSWLVPHGFPLMSVGACGCEFATLLDSNAPLSSGQGLQWNLPQRGVQLLPYSFAIEI